MQQLYPNSKWINTNCLKSEAFFEEWRKGGEAQVSGGWLCHRSTLLVSIWVRPYEVQHIRQISNKDILQSTGNYTHYLVITCGRGLVTKSCPTLATSWTAACQTPLSMEFSRQEYGSGLPFPSSGDLLDPGIQPRSPVLQTDSLPIKLRGKPCHNL